MCETELEKIVHALHRKGGIKKTAKAHERIWCVREKYLSIEYHYDMEVETSADKLTATRLIGFDNEQQYVRKESTLCVCFLGISLLLTDEVIVLQYYPEAGKFFPLPENKCRYRGCLSQIRCQLHSTSSSETVSLLA